VAIECLPGSTLPAELRERFGYNVTTDGEGERILAGAVIERFARRADGELERVTEGSSRPVTHSVTHAGIVWVQRYGFEIP
jgi:hypothetical protein